MKRSHEPTLAAIRGELLIVQHRLDAREATADPNAPPSERRPGQRDVEVAIPVVGENRPAPPPPRVTRVRRGRPRAES